MNDWPEHSLPGPVDVDYPSAERPSERYGFVRVVGTGGMGRVEAVHDRVLGRDVARKTAPPGASAGVLSRLHREARITARLDHPGIVPVYDGGDDATGRPWYTMRLVRGRSFGAVVAETDPRARLGLVPRLLAACEAVAYAHSLGVVHRDLTPANVLVGPFGETVVVDWGIARALDASEPGDEASASDPRLTSLGAVIGTPEWMSPEQARGEPADRRSDVYALGRLLHLLCTADAPPDLRAVVRKAVATDPDDRYPDAAALAAELEAWLAGRRVAAHAYAPRELVGRLVRTWRVPLGVAAVAALALAGVGATAWVRTTAERDRAVEAERGLGDLLAATRADLALSSLRDGDTAAAARVAAEALADRDLPLARGVLAATLAGPEVRRVDRLALERCTSAVLSPDGARVACGGDDLAVIAVDAGGVEWRGAAVGAAGWSRPDGPLLSLHRGDLLVQGPDGLRGIGLVALPRGGLRPAPRSVDVAIADQDAIWFVGLDGGTDIVRCPAGERALTLVVSGDAFVIPCDGGSLLRGHGRAVESTQRIGVVRASAGAWLSDGRLVLGTLDAGVVVVDAEGGVRDLGSAGIGPVRRVVASPDDRHVAVGGEWGAVRLVDLGAGTVAASLDAEGHAFVWGAEGLRVATPRGVDTYEVRARAPVLPAPHGLADVAVAPDGRVALADGGGVLTVYDPTGAWRSSWQWQSGVLKAAAWSPDGGSLWAGGESGTLRRIADGAVHDPGFPKHARALAPFDGGVWVANWTPQVFRVFADGRVAPALDGVATLLQAAGGRTLVVAERPWARIVEADGTVRTVLDGDQDGGAALSTDGAELVVVRGRDVRRMDATTGAPIGTLALPEAPTAVLLHEGVLWSGYVDGTLRAHAADGSRIEVRLHTGRISDLAVSGDHVLSASWDGTARRWARAAAEASRADLVASGGPSPARALR